MNTIEEYELQGPSVRFVVGDNGEGLFCETDESGELVNCKSEEEWVYDRGFGG